MIVVVAAALPLSASASIESGQLLLDHLFTHPILKRCNTILETQMLGDVAEPPRGDVAIDAERVANIVALVAAKICAHG